MENEDRSVPEKNLSAPRGWPKMAKGLDSPAPQDTSVHEIAFNFTPDATNELAHLVLEHPPYPLKREDIYYVVVPDKTDAEAYIAFLKTNAAVDADSIDYTQHT